MSAETPTLSIVIASLNGRPYIDACLAALARQQGDMAAEVIVAECVGTTVTDFVRAEYPAVRLIAFDERKSVPELRAAGILAARGEIIAITEDHCIPAGDWYLSLVAAHRQYPGPAIGGAVDNAATDRLIDWAVFFCEYSNFISPVPAGAVHDLPGPNVSYKRAALDTMRDMIAKGYWENFLHQRLESAGHQLWSDPTVKVWHKKHFRFGDFFAERFHYGRWYAGTRNEFTSLPKRLFYLAFSPLLPPLIMTRIARRVWSRGRHYRDFLKALPLILVFMAAWAAGEFTGYATGPGSSVLELS
ncbi:MAG: glycosyltransferase [Chloroflexi bacterium]|nr:glycosyltransferase [Chloroflexota bacterium]MCI0579123.1 glycosyltransferase [Chloroflexota bacterium]MCI0643340.1 glycosyltransferase [Chloroflexota bacterium]MCI0728319.1 glycosyltransferase [Chloroflexota bacterium]